jgi:hypothetical protein
VEDGFLARYNPVRACFVNVLLCSALFAEEPVPLFLPRIGDLREPGRSSSTAGVWRVCPVSGGGDTVFDGVPVIDDASSL